MAYTSIDKPTDYFETKLHNGTGSSKTLAYDFEVDFFWTKKRNDAYGSYIYDSVRGNNKRLQVSQTNTEDTPGNTISFGNSSGITIGSDSGNYGVNQTQTDGGSAATYVGWGWLAGGSASSNSNGSITSSVSANTTAGISIVSYTGTGSSATVGHGLGVKPSAIIIKTRESAGNWVTYFGTRGATKYLELNNAAKEGTSTAAFNNTEPTSSVFTVNTWSNTNDSSNGMIAYCFANTKGFSKFDEYVGNGNANGTFVYTGFRPAWLMVKNATHSSGSKHWGVHDNKREISNTGYGSQIDIDDSYAEFRQTNRAIDFLSNGFKIRSSDSDHNTSGDTYIYFAFAEAPFVTSKGIPTTAR